MSTKVLSILMRMGRAASTMLLAVSLLTFGPMLAYAAPGDQLWGIPGRIPGTPHLITW